MEQAKAPIEHSLICGAPKSKEYGKPRVWVSRPPLTWLFMNIALVSAVGAIGLIYASLGHMLAGAVLAMLGFGALGTFLTWAYRERVDG